MMRHWLAPALLPALLLLPTPARADETPQTKLEFAKKLRERRMAELALDYLLQLQKSPPPGVASALPVEIARTRVEVALDRAPEQRMPLLNEARAELEAFLKKNAQAPEANGVKLEMARVTGYMGQAYMGQAYRQEDKEAKLEFAGKARKKFEDAGKELAALAKATSSADPENAASRLEAGKNLLDIAGTILDVEKTANLKEQAELRKKADTQLKELAQDKGAPGPVRFMALAWVIRTAQLTQEQTRAHDYFTGLMQVQDPDARDAQRWARYFHILNIYDNPQVDAKEFKGNKSKLVEQLCRSWLTDYPTYKNTTAGYGVMFQLGDALLKQAQAVEGGMKVAAARDLYGTAEKLFAVLADSDSRFAEEAGRLNFQISILRLGEGVTVDQLTTFKDCFTKARWEMIQFQEAGQKLAEAARDGKEDEKKKYAQKRKDHLQTIVAAFQRALALATPLTPPQDVADVRFYMAYTYFLAGDQYRTAVLGEYLGRQDPPGSRSASAANYAIQAYVNILNANNVEANRDRLREFAEFVVKDRAKAWAEEPVLPIARYQLAMVALRDKDHDAAIAHLQQIPKDFNAYTFGQCQLAFTALTAAANAPTVEKKKEYRTRAVQALKNAAELPKGADPATVQMYFAAQLEMGKMMYDDAGKLLRDGHTKPATKNYEEMAAFTAKMLKTFEEAGESVPAEARDQLKGAWETLSKFARLGQSNMEYKAGAYDKVLSGPYTGDVVDAVKTLGKAKGPIPMPNARVTGELIGLAMRANVQKGKLDDARTLLDLLQRLEDPDAIGDVGSGAVLQTLIGEMQKQVEDLRAAKETDKLKDTVKNFTAFLDALAGKKNLGTQEVFFLANSYAGLDNHEKAAELYGRLELPTEAAPPKEVADDPEKLRTFQENAEKDRQLWWFTQGLYGRELRLARELGKAEEVLKKVIDNPKAAGRLRAVKEWNHLLMDKEDYRKAIEEWGKLVANPAVQGRVKDDPQMKEFYFDSWLHFIESWYRYSQTSTVKGTPSEQKFIDRAANYILQLEYAKDQAGWQVIEDRVRQMLLDTPRLNESYLKMKRDRITAGS